MRRQHTVLVNIVFILLFLGYIDAFSQTQESTTIGGYGNAMYRHDFNSKISTMDLERVVLFIGHRFSNRISLVSELEMEDAKVSGGEAGGEIAFEQAFLRFNIDEGHYIVAGLFLPRVGILNEDHLPTSFNGNERNQVETYILPSTWRELGIGLYGGNDFLPLTYSFALVNGLNSAAFEHGSVIREGRFEGRNASANNLALTGALQYYRNNLMVQVSGYYGGSVGLAPEQADNLKLAPGPFATPVIMGEADVRFGAGAMAFRLLGAFVSIPNAEEINRAYSNNTPKSAYGAYAELAYDILYQQGAETGQEQLIAFARLEKVDMNAGVPANAIKDGTLNQLHLTMGLNYLPVNNVVVKADVRFMDTGDNGPALFANSIAVAGAENRSNSFFTLGIGYSF